MTVKELILELQKYDDALEVYNLYSGEKVKRIEDDEHGELILIIE
jgi:hypothetical protein